MTLPRAMAAALLALSLPLPGCHPATGIVLVGTLANPCDDDGTLSFHLTETGRVEWGGITVWTDREQNHGARGTRVPGGTLQVTFVDDGPDTEMRFAGVPVEVYEGRDRLEIPSRFEAVGRTDGSCGYGYVTSFDMSALAPGTYTLVHRRSTGINGEVYCGKEACPWSTFAGEPALVMTLKIPAPSELPVLTAAEVEPAVERAVRLAARCYDDRVANAKRHRLKMPPTQADRRLSVDVPLVADRAHGKVSPPRAIPSLNPWLEECLLGQLAAMRFDARPTDGTVARLEIVVRAGTPLVVTAKLTAFGVSLPPPAD